MRLVTYRAPDGDGPRRPRRRRRASRELAAPVDARLAARRRREPSRRRATRSRRSSCSRRCPSRRASATSSPSRATSRPAGGCAEARSRGLVRGARLLLLQPGVDPRARTSRCARPAATQALDFELEIAAVIGARRRDRRLHAVQRLERPRRPARGDDRRARPGQGQGLRDLARPVAGHARRAALRGRPARARGDRVASTATELTRTDAAEQHWSWPELVAHAARDTRLRPGDVLGSGTLNRGCLLELGPLEGERFLEPGDAVDDRGRGPRHAARPTVGLTATRPAARTASRARPASACA